MKLVLTKPRLVVFDLDGTLIDSRADLCNSVNATLADCHYPPLDPDVVAGYVGDGAETLVRRSLAHQHAVAGQPDPHDDAFVDRALRFFLDWYSVHKVDETRPYPGVMDALERIRRSEPKILMACLTNKPVHASRAICTHFGLDRYFFRVYGGNSFAAKKPHPEGLRTLINEAADRTKECIEAQEVTMVGDSPVDVLTARACGTKSVGCLFGLDPDGLRTVRPDALVESAKEWPNALGLK